MDFDVDLMVIGGGSGGVRAARIAAGHGARVAICEEYRYGGTCVIRGCVPKKFFVYAAHFAEEFEDARRFGWTVGDRHFDWATLVANKDQEIDRLNGIYHGLLDNAGVERLAGRGIFLDPHTVQVGDRKIRAERILLATGGRPVMPGIPGIEHAISSNEAFHLASLPERIIVVGGGYIAVEFAGIFNGLGRQVTQLYRGEQILRGFDDDVRHHLAAEIRKKGIDLRVGCNPARIDLVADAQPGNRYRVTLENGDALSTDLIMYATGRQANTADMGLEKAGVLCSKNGVVAVDEWSMTNVPHIFAVGDVTDRINLTPVAIMEGHAFADTVYGGLPRKPVHENVASAVFSQPSVSSVGLTEAQAEARYETLDIYKSSFRALKNTLSGNAETTLMKLIVDAASDRVVGVHMVGPDSAEIMQGLSVAVQCGATKAQFDATVGIHPTLAEEYVTMRQKWQPPQAEAAE